MGLKDRGHVLRLERCAQKLAPFNVTINQSSIVSTVLSLLTHQQLLLLYSRYVLQELCDVGTWLHSLELQGYQQLFEAAGYKTRDDLENLKGLKRMHLQKMGISKRGRNKKNHSLVTSHTLPIAHLHRFEEGILRLSYLYDAKFRLMPEVVTWLEQHDCTVSLKSLTRFSHLYYYCAWERDKLPVIP